jgi:hypothetical protein
MSIVGAPSGRSGATNFFELIGGFFSLWDLNLISNFKLRISKLPYRDTDSVQDFILPSTGDR